MLFASTWQLPVLGWIGIFVGILLVGFIIGVFVARKVTQKYMEKNPPINEKMVRIMYQQMGRTPSEKQVRQVMAAVSSQSQGNAKK